MFNKVCIRWRKYFNTKEYILYQDYSSCLPVSLPVRVKKLISQCTEFCDILYREMLLNSVKKIHIGLTSDKNIRRYTCGLLQLLG
jgi:hypothetical protein